MVTLSKRGTLHARRQVAWPASLTLYVSCPGGHECDNVCVREARPPTEERGVRNSLPDPTTLVSFGGASGHFPLLTMSVWMQALAFIYDAEVVATLFEEGPERYGERPGGYCRVINELPRRGDNAPMARIEMV